jgi:hypothetical protein
MELHSLSIATICWARTPEEEDVLKRSLAALADIGLPVLITDGGSREDFLQFLRSVPNFSIRQQKGLWPQAKSSLREAAQLDTPFIFYTEPDKEDLFTRHLKSVLDGIELEADTGIHLLSRSAHAFASFPSFQQMTETAINNCCAAYTDKQVDHTYGPFIINAKLIPYLDALPEQIGWGWRPYAFIRAKQLGFQISYSEGDFRCPQAQQADNAAEQVYRMKQLVQNVEGISVAASIEDKEQQ